MGPEGSNNRRRFLVPLLAALLIASSCTNQDPATDSSTTDTSTADSSTTDTSTPDSSTASDLDTARDGFDDHTLLTIDNRETFFALARRGVGEQAATKFVITDFSSEPGSTDVHWYDTNFFELHDEWYWYRLLNGQPAPGTTATPLVGRSFETVESIYAWAEQNRDDLGLDLRWISSRTFGRDRLYSPNFYSLALERSPRVYGVGTLLHVKKDGDDRWLLELEYVDEPRADEVALFFEHLSLTLPNEIASSLEWVVRSPAQEATAQKMETEGLPFGDRVVRYDELVEEGEVAVYNQGIAAGRLLLVTEDRADLTDARDDDILLLEHVPDWLPPAAALLTANPQTPLSHVNLLARNRGIPNASRAGLLDDPGIIQAARGRAYVIVRTTGEDGLEVTLISPAEYELWRARLTKEPVVVPTVDPTSIPVIVDLTTEAAAVVDEGDIEQWRPIIGGKAAGFLNLLSAPGISPPDQPVALTVGPYMEHLVGLERELFALLDDPKVRSDQRARYLFLEGPEAYASAYEGNEDSAFADEIFEDNPPNTPLGAILTAGGFQRLVRDTPIDPSTVTTITSELQAQFGDYASTQGLRFRSSASVEDIEGFTGAGLYDSNTGFLDPTAAVEEKDKKKTVEWAILKTWSSYWSFEAFEERRRERIDHASGAMAVLIHARFDDPLEVNNGVATITLSPDGEAVAVVNTQIDDISVTNPSVDELALPEILEITRTDETVTIDRVADSSLSEGKAVLADKAANDLFVQLESVAHLWRERVNAALPAEQRISTLTLDIEFRTMAAGWPARPDFTEPPRLVLKQARVLDPGLRGVPSEVRELPVPRDVLARLAEVLQIDCPSDSWFSITTDPTGFPDMGYSESPLLVDKQTALSAAPEEITGDCTQQIVYSTPDRYLAQLLDNSGSPLLELTS